MPRIPSYPLAGSVSNDDLMLIDDVSEVYTTKSLKLSTLKGYVNTGQATTTYVDDKVVSGASFNTGTGVLTLTRTDGIDVTENLDGRYAVTSSLATVATSGSYNDLSDKPFIPSGTVTSVGLSMPSAFYLIGSPITSAGVFVVTGAGNSSQYIDGTGSLQTFPTIPTNNNQLTNGAGYTTNLGIVQSLTTTGSSGAATLTNGVLNIPQYSSGGTGTETEVAIFGANNSITSDSAIAINSTSQIILDVLYNSASYASDAEATAAGVPYGGLYRYGSVVMINMDSSPSPSPGEVTIGSLIWTDANSTIVASSSGTIPIATNAADMVNAYNNSTPMAAYWNFDSNNSNRGLFYNQPAAAIITPPSGFRMPTAADWNNLANELDDISGSTNDVTAGGGGTTAYWNANIKSNSNYGQSGFNAIGTGYTQVNTIAITVSFSSEGSGYWWKEERVSGTSNTVPTFLGQTSFISYGGHSGATNAYPIRFCKDA